MINERAICPHCGGGILEWAAGLIHCAFCGRDFDLVPVRPEVLRRHSVLMSRQNDDGRRRRRGRVGVV